MADTETSKESNITEAELQKEIAKILENADLQNTSTNKVIQKLEKKFGTSLKEKKKLIDRLVLDYVNSLDSSDSEEEEEKKSDSEKEEEEEEEEKKPRIKKEKEEDSEKPKRRGKRNEDKKKKTPAKGKKGGVTKRGGKGSGYTKPIKLSSALSELVGATELPRHEVVKRVWAIIKERQLIDPNNRQFAICDKPLYKVIGTQRFYTFGGGTSLNTLKIQFILQTNYDKLDILIEKHQDSINKCLRPLVNEILDVDPNPNDEEEFKKLFRKISIYIILSSGLGNPGFIVTLKEGMSALESVYSMDELKVFVALPKVEKMEQLKDLLEIVSGVRLFNRDCKKGGEGIPDLPFNLVDAGKACLTSLSTSLITIMQRVNTLTTAIQDCIVVQDETGNTMVEVEKNCEVTVEDYYEVFELLAFNRQYEVFTRKLLYDVEYMTKRAGDYVNKTKSVLEELHTAVRYKAAVPVVAVFPLFSKLWQVWRAMQNIMFLVSTVNRLMSIMSSIQEQIKIPYEVLEKMLKGKTVISDQDRMGIGVTVEERLALAAVKDYVAYNEIAGTKEKHVEFLGFCAVCLSLGALMPSIMKVGVIKVKGLCYGFCSVKMALKFSVEPQRYINEVLEFSRNNPHLINLLNIVDNVYFVKDIEVLVSKRVAKIKVTDRDIQTETHPLQEYHEKNYTSDLWEWKRRACQWATIVNCQTHSTQTHYSHLRSEIHCQTVEPRDKCLQTTKERGINTTSQNYFLWGLRGVRGLGQHNMDLRTKFGPDKLKAATVTTCKWPCIGGEGDEDNEVFSSESEDFYHSTYEPEQ